MTDFIKNLGNVNGHRSSLSENLEHLWDPPVERFVMEPNIDNLLTQLACLKNFEFVFCVINYGN